MNVWHKIKSWIIAAGWIIASVFGIALLCRKRGKSNDTGTVSHEREIRDGINRQGQSIDDSIQRIEDIKKRIDGIENVAGNNAERESATQELVDESRKLRKRAKKLIEKQGN